MFVFPLDIQTHLLSVLYSSRYYPSESRTFHSGILRASLERLPGSYLAVGVITQYHVYWILSFFVVQNSLSRACSYFDFNSLIVGLLAVVKSANLLSVISICLLVVSSRELILTLNIGMERLRISFMVTIAFTVRFMVRSSDSTS